MSCWHQRIGKECPAIEFQSHGAPSPTYINHVDQAIDTGNLVFAFEANPSWRVECEKATELDARRIGAPTKCPDSSSWDPNVGVGPYDTFCVMFRRYWFFAAMSDSVKNITFHVAPNPYCSSAEAFRSEVSNDGNSSGKRRAAAGAPAPAGARPPSATNWENFDKEGVNDEEIKPWLSACWTLCCNKVKVC